LTVLNRFDLTNVMLWVETFTMISNGRGRCIISLFDLHW